MAVGSLTTNRQLESQLHFVRQPPTEGWTHLWAVVWLCPSHVGGFLLFQLAVQ